MTVDTCDYLLTDCTVGVVKLLPTNTVSFKDMLVTVCSLLSHVSNFLSQAHFKVLELYVRTQCNTKRGMIQDWWRNVNLYNGV